MNINERIRLVRIDRGLKQSVVANALGMSSSRLSALETGIQNPTIQQIEAISRYFNVSSDYLIFGVEMPTNTDRELLKLIKEDSGLMQSLMAAMNAKKNVLNRLAA